MNDRREKDLLGNTSIPASCYWGIHTQRAYENFRISNTRTPPALIRALAMVKKACCRANAELGYLSSEAATAISTACDDIIEGRLDDWFPLDALQGGAGTSTNMNLNEVLANRALELLGRQPGDYDLLHPLEHINLHQSTNDVYPTAVKVAAIFELRALSEGVTRLQNVLQQKEKQFAGIVKIGRTELQMAVPMTLGAEFGAFAEAFARDRWRTFKCEERLRVVNLGGTAVGTGITAPRSYIFLVIEKLREITGLGLSRGENCVDQTANADAFVEVSGITKALATNVIKVSNDLRLLHSIGEIRLPPVQAGSSVMPGKVNPVILECAVQAAIKAKANDAVVAECAERGSLQINEFLPLLASALLESLSCLRNTALMLAGHLDRVAADEAVCLQNLESCPTIITAFLPDIGYERATRLLQEYEATGESNVRAFLERKLGADLVSRLLSPQNLTALGHREKERISP